MFERKPTSLRLYKMTGQENRFARIFVYNVNFLHSVKIFPLLLLLTFFMVLNLISTVNSVIMPPRFYSTRPAELPLVESNNKQLTDYFNDSDEMPYLLSINEGETIDIKTNSKSSITVNLNRAIAENLTVVVSVNSRPELISFDPIKSIDKGDIQQQNKTSDHNNNTVILNYMANTFGDRIVAFHTNVAAGHAEIVCKIETQPKDVNIDDSKSFISVNIGKSLTIKYIISIVGWIYFVAWSLSFYFQVILNYQRKSVIGLNFDFLALNLMGFTCYTIFNYTLMFSREAQKDYYHRHEFSRIPVEYNDLFFAAHAVLITLVTVIQCFIYDRGDQRVSIPAAGFIVLALLGGIGCFITHLVSSTTLILLDVLLYFSYVKLIITLVKYTPQAYMNYKRKATTGWSIHNILLDFTGGSFSIAQMFLSSYNYDDWLSIFGNFTKFGLGAISITFDILFVVQHYILYRQIGELDVSTESIPSPIISQSVMSASYRQPSEDGNVADKAEEAHNDHQIDNQQQQ